MSEGADEKRMKLRYAGTCRVCGGEVPEERLDALPWTTLCVRCKADGHSN